MKWLPFKLSEQEKQAMKEAGKSKSFKAFQKEVIIYLILMALAFVFLWKHQNILMLFVVAMAIIIGARYNQALKSSKATYSIGEKVEKEIKRQQELTKKVALPVIFGVVGVFILFIAGLIVYVLYLKPYLSSKPEVTFPPVGQEQKPAEEIITDAELVYIEHHYDTDNREDVIWSVPLNNLSDKKIITSIMHRYCCPVEAEISPDGSKLFYKRIKPSDDSRYECQTYSQSRCEDGEEFFIFDFATKQSMGMNAEEALSTFKPYIYFKDLLKSLGWEGVSWNIGFSPDGEEILGSISYFHANGADYAVESFSLDDKQKHTWARGAQKHYSPIWGPGKDEITTDIPYGTYFTNPDDVNYAGELKILSRKEGEDVLLNSSEEYMFVPLAWCPDKSYLAVIRYYCEQRKYCHQELKIIDKNGTVLPLSFLPDLVEFVGWVESK